MLINSRKCQEKFLKKNIEEETDGILRSTFYNKNCPSREFIHLKEMILEKLVKATPNKYRHVQLESPDIYEVIVRDKGKLRNFTGYRAQ